METPKYDWAYAVVRNYFYTQAKKVKIDSLRNSSYEPLSDITIKMNMEIYYHLLHWKMWFEQLLTSTDDAKERMNKAIDLVVKDFADMFSFGNDKEAIESFDFIAKEEELKNAWKAAVTPVFEKVGIAFPNIPETPEKNGRNGEHTKDLDEALSTLSEVYRTDLAASW